MRNVLGPLMACLCTSALADDGVGLTEADFFGDQPLVLTASRLAQPQQQAPAMVTVIDRQMIETSGFTEIPELLRLVPGFQVTFSYSWRPTVTYHGLSDDFSRRMQVLVDGRTIYNPGFGQVNWRELPLTLEDIDRIEVVHGPDAASYGTNAFFAVINIITRHAADEPGWYGVVSQGSDDIARYGLRYSGSQGDLDYRLTLDDRADRRFDNKPDRAHDRLLNLRTDYRPGNRDTITTQVGLSSSGWDAGDNFDPADDYPPHEVDNQAGFVQLRWQRALSPGTEWSLQYYYEWNDYEDDWKVLSLPGIPLDLDYDTRRHNVEFQAIASPNETTRLVWGAEVRQDSVRSKHFFGTNDRLTDELYRLFANVEWRFQPKWTLNAGGMLEEHYFVGTRFSPRLSVHYLPTPRQALRVAVTQAYRTPTYLERHGDAKFNIAGQFMQDVVPSKDLDPEYILSRELGYVGEFPEAGVTVNARLFYDRLEDLIDDSRLDWLPDVFDGRARRYVNAFHGHVYGGEYQLQWRPDDQTRLILNQAVAKANGNDERDFDEAVPRHTFSVLAMRDFDGGFTGSIGYYYVSGQEWQADGDFIESYERLDLRLAKRWKTDGNRYELALVAQNLLADYSEYEDENDFVHRVYGSFRIWH
jgi:iron complex outermembrane receptor protein